MISLAFSSSFAFIIGLFYYSLAARYNKKRIWTAMKGVSILFIFAFFQGILGFIFAEFLVDFLISYTLGGVVLALYASYLYYDYLKSKWEKDKR